MAETADRVVPETQLHAVHAPGGANQAGKGTKAMTATSISVHPPNSVILILDSQFGEIPISMSGELISATGTCIAVGTLSENDGPTRLELLTPSDLPEVQSELQVAWQGGLETRSGILAVQNVEGDTLMEMTVDSTTILKIVVNDPTEPDDIRIVVG